VGTPRPLLTAHGPMVHILSVGSAGFCGTKGCCGRVTDCLEPIVRCNTGLGTVCECRDPGVAEHGNHPSLVGQSNTLIQYAERRTSNWVEVEVELLLLLLQVKIRSTPITSKPVAVCIGRALAGTASLFGSLQIQTRANTAPCFRASNIPVKPHTTTQAASLSSTAHIIQIQQHSPCMVLALEI
jgi:hypothetical protein